VTSPKVKVCGITRSEDALLASALGAFAVGFIFAKSLRQVSATQVAEIVPLLPSDLSTVGVFMDQDLTSLLQIVEETKIKAVQLHGQETPEYVSKLKSLRPDLIVYKAIGVSDEGLKLSPVLFDECDFLLFDSTTHRDASQVRPLLPWKILKDLQLSRPFFVAGGLRSENVVEVIRELGPYGVDVSSGVESQPGLKNKLEMNNFFKAIGGTSQ
jgi:phosphoribosylanthranilate isomerase